MTEYGIFSDEGMVDGPYDDRFIAEDVCERDPDYVGCTVFELCPDHDGEAAEFCSVCVLEEDDE